MPEEIGGEYMLVVTMQLMVSWGLLLVIFKRSSRDRRVGKRIASQRAESMWRTILLGLHAGLLLVLSLGEGAGDQTALLSILASGALVLLVPGESDLSCGQGGISSGWEAVPYEELRGWRFESGVLHFLLAGAWHELAVPPESRPLLRGILRGRAAESEVE